MPTKTTFLRPVADTGSTNWTQTPNDGQFLFHKIDESVAAHDGDATKIHHNSPNEFALFRVELPSDFKTQRSVTFRVAAKADVDTSHLVVSLDLNGSPVFVTAVDYVFTGQAGTWIVFESVNPENWQFSDGDLIDVRLNPLMFPASGSVHVSAFEIELTYSPKPGGGPTADGEEVSASADGAAGGPLAAGAPVAPTASATAGSPAASGAALSPWSEGTAASLPSVSAVAVRPSAAGIFGKPYADGAALAPSAAGVSTAPTATGVAVRVAIGGGA